MSEIERDEALEEVVEKSVYEAGFLLDPALTEEEVAKKQEDFKSFVTNLGAEVIAEGTPLSQKLTYTIEVKKDSKKKEFTKASFSWIKFDLLPDSIESVDSMLKNDESVVRYIVVKTVRENTLREPLEDEEGFVSEDETEEGEELVEDVAEEDLPKLEEEVVL